jgi:hypothetical protein
VKRGRGRVNEAKEEREDFCETEGREIGLLFTPLDVEAGGIGFSRGGGGAGAFGEREVAWPAGGGQSDSRSGTAGGDCAGLSTKLVGSAVRGGRTEEEGSS